MLASAAVLLAALAAEPVPPGATPEGDGPARREHQNGEIEFGLVPIASGHFHASLTTLPFQDGRPLGPLEFYQIVGRADLAAEYQARSTRRSLLVGLGIAAIVGGGVYTAANLSSSPPDPRAGFDSFVQQANQQSRNDQEAMTTGLVISAGGVLLAVIGLLTDPNPVDELEARHLADDYNRRLRGEVGTSEPGLAPGSARPERPRLSLGAAPFPGGGIAELAVAF